MTVLAISGSRDYSKSDFISTIQNGELKALNQLLKAEAWRRKLKDFSSESDDIDLSEEYLNDWSSQNQKREYSPSFMTLRKRKVFWQPMPFVPHDYRQSSRDKDEGTNRETPNSATILRYG
jgi:hypothetical protein